MAAAMAPPLTWAQEDYGLDRRLTKACKKAGWVSPTLVQQTAIPLILKGKDVLCRARTGAGKTAAYLLPVMHTFSDTLPSATHSTIIPQKCAHGQQDTCLH